MTNQQIAELLVGTEKELSVANAAKLYQQLTGASPEESMASARALPHVTATGPVRIMLEIIRRARLAYNPDPWLRDLAEDCVVALRGTE